MRETGVITKVAEDTIEISVTINEGCHNCGNKDTCGTAGKIITALKNGHNCHIGEKAEIEIANTSLWVLVVFMAVPLAFIFIGYFIGKQVFAGETIANLMGVGGLVLGFLVVFILGKLKLFNTKPYVVAVYSNDSAVAENSATCCSQQ